MLAGRMGEWIDGWLAEGMAKGLAKGLADGRAEGEAWGLAQGKADMLLRMLRRRFGSLDEATVARVRAADSPSSRSLERTAVRRRGTGRNFHQTADALNAGDRAGALCTGGSAARAGSCIVGPCSSRFGA